MKKAIEAEEKCRLSGTLEMPKTPGFLKVELLSNGGIMRDAMDLAGKVSARYRLDQLEFGRSTTEIDVPIVYQSEYFKGRS